MMTRVRALLCIVPLVLLSAGAATANWHIACSGDWHQPMGPRHTSALPALLRDARTYLSSAAAGIIGLTGGRGRWVVQVRRDDNGKLRPNLTLLVRRTGDGQGTGRIDGGTDFQTVGPTNVPFFSGDGPHTGVPFEVKAEKPAATAPAAEYRDFLVYTVTDIP
jgi:hypothetical protein